MNISLAPDLDSVSMESLIETRLEIEERLTGANHALENTRKLEGFIDEDVYNSRISACQKNIHFWQNTLAEVERQIRLIIDLHSIDHDSRSASHARVICRLAKLIEGVDMLTNKMNRQTQSIIISLSRVGECP